MRLTKAMQTAQLDNECAPVKVNKRGNSISRDSIGRLILERREGLLDGEY